MFKKILFLLCILQLVNVKILIAQSFTSLRLTGEYNFFSMSDLKDIQTEIKSELQQNDIPAEIVESFPAYPGLQFQLVFPIKFYERSYLNAGFLFDFSSTGGRVHYGDYSGEVMFDQVVKVYSLGGILEIAKKKNDNLTFTMGVKLLGIWASLKNSIITRIGNNQAEDNIDVSAFTVGLEPNTGIFFTKFNFMIGLNIGYLLCIPSSYSLSSNSDVIFLKQSGKNVGIGTNGFRIGISFGYNFMN